MPLIGRNPVMVSWLVDNARTAYFLLGIATLVLVALWWMNRSKKYLFALALPLALIGLTWLLTLFIVTDIKRLERACQAIAEGIRQRDLNRVFSHISPNFDQANLRKMSKEELRVLAKNHMDRHGAENVHFSKFSFGDVSREKTAHVEFWVFGVPELEGAPIRCEATFVWFKQESWQMKGFKLFVANTGNQYPFP